MILMLDEIRLEEFNDMKESILIRERNVIMSNFMKKIGL